MTLQEIIVAPKPLYLPATEVPRFYENQILEGYYKIVPAEDGGLNWIWQPEPWEGPEAAN
jgi:hypothetical protein